MIFIPMHSDETHYHKKGFLLSFVLKVRVFGTLKYPIDNASKTTLNDRLSGPYSNKHRPRKNAPLKRK